MYEKEVAKGSAWLDQVAPGWYNKINERSFNMRTYTSCAMAQIWGATVAENLTANKAFAITHGFGVYTSFQKLHFLGFKYISRDSEKQQVAKYQNLSATWLQEILRRRANDRMLAEASDKTQQKESTHA